LEFLAWAKINKIDISRLQVIYDDNELKTTDWVFVFYYGNFASETGNQSRRMVEFVERYKKIKAKKIVHLTHYFYGMEKGLKQLESVKPDMLVAESDLQKTSVAIKSELTGMECGFLVLPFVPQRRFVEKTNLGKRDLRAIATGTLTFPITDNAFKKYFGTTILHPMRQWIYENQDRLKAYIDCKILPIDQGNYKAPKNKIISTILNQFNNRQKKYYSFNIVDLYNKYAMFIVPEEIAGLPGIGFVEGMRCGCAYIGIESPIYNDIGMIPNIHYVAYDGTPDGLINAIEKIQSDPQKLTRIAEKGKEFAIEQLNGEKVTTCLLNALRIV
jgi:glycosyltransferase involved in cell wall biosynthesis